MVRVERERFEQMVGEALDGLPPELGRVMRNVAVTAPYFHDGTIPTLEAAVDTMARYQLGRKMSKDDIDAIVAFLKTLTGEQPEILGGNKGHQ